MCLAYPAEVLAMTGDGTAEVSARGRTQRVLLAVLADADPPVAIGDWLLVDCGLALARIDADDAAQRTEWLDALTGDRR
jgi:hydrogenase assembly chaperone HypC/HupF